MSEGNVKVLLVPWDDRAFTTAFERAAAGLAGLGLTLDMPTAAVVIQRALRADGYPDAAAWCERSVDEALSHQARCVVSRDGPVPEPLRPTR
ncbi:MAG TPA: hypothetical protein VIH00_03285 [Candidatus Limnocylindrales bacterium]